MLSRLMTRREQLLLVIVATSVLAGAAALYVYNRDDGEPAAGVSVEEAVVAPTEAPANVETRRVEPVTEDEPLGIDPVEIAAPPTVAASIMGAVRRPGMYEFDADSRVQDLVDTAGGVTEDADVSDINGAARLIDGSTLTIPVRGVAMVADGTLVARGGQSAAELNPAQYTISGRQACTAMGREPDVILYPPRVLGHKDLRTGIAHILYSRLAQPLTATIYCI